jgi:hypothetical protein
MGKSKFYRFLEIVAVLGVTPLILVMFVDPFCVAADRATRIPADLRASLPWAMAGFLLVGWLALFVPFRHRVLAVVCAFALAVLSWIAVLLLK